MTNILPFRQRTQLVTDQDRRIADKIEAACQAAGVTGPCPCMFRELYGLTMCQDCPENPNKPEGAA